MNEHSQGFFTEATRGEEHLGIVIRDERVWGLRLRPDGVMAATLATMGPNGVRTVVRQEDCPEDVDCPVPIFQKLTPPEDWPAEAEGREKAALWYGRCLESRRTVGLLNNARAFFFPDGLPFPDRSGLLSRVVHFLLPCSLLPGVHVPVGDSLAPVPGSGVTVVMPRLQGRSYGMVPLSSWYRDVWDEVSPAIVVLDHRGAAGRGGWPLVHASCAGSLNGRPFEAGPIRLQEAGLQLQAREVPGLERVITCETAPFRNALRIGLTFTCEEPVRVIEIFGTSSGSFLRVRYPLASDGHSPWAAAFEERMAALRHPGRQELEGLAFPPTPAFAVRRKDDGERADDRYLEEVTGIPAVLRRRLGSSNLRKDAAAGKARAPRGYLPPLARGGVVRKDGQASDGRGDGADTAPRRPFAGIFRRMP